MTTPTRGAARLPAAVLWDMDGTLVDTEPYWFASERDIVEEFGHEWPDEHALAMVGFDLLDSAAYMQEHGHVPLEREEIVERMLDGVIARIHREIPWRPGARELLAELNELGVPCALVTMSWRRFADPVLAALPAGSFVATITGDEVPDGEGKPHPTPYLLGADAVGLAPEDCVAIEDSPTGVRSALAAGCRVVGVPNVKALDPAPGLAIVDSLDGLEAADLLDVTQRAPTGESTTPSIVELLDRPKVRLAVAGASIVALLVVLAFVAFGGGDDSGEPALPPGAVPVDVWAPYWALDDSVPEVSVRLDDVREVSLFWFSAVGADQIVIDEHTPSDLADQFLDAVESGSHRLVPSIQDAMPAGGMAAVIADPETRTRHVEAIVAFAAEYDAAGIDLDYEQFAFADGRSTWADTRPNWVAFIEQLAGRLHEDGRTLTVSIPPQYDPEVRDSGGFWVYDHGAIAEHVDAIRIMAYDFSTAEAGPISPLSWVHEAVDGTSMAVPEEYHDKLVLGVPAYGGNWVVDTLGECPEDAAGRSNVTARSALELAERREGVPEFDPVSGEWVFVYTLAFDDSTTSCVQTRHVQWVDAEGVASRVEIARRAGWGGVALWALGYEDQDVWDALVTASQADLAPAE